MLVIMAGMLDSFLLTIDQAEIAYLSHNSDRMMVILDSVYPTSPDQVDPLTALILDPTRVSALLQLADEDGEPLFSDGDAGLIMEGELKNGEESISIAVEMLPFDEAPVWAPSLVEGQLPGGTPGIVISEKAMRDLGLAVGDLITFEHPAREDIFTFRMIESQVKVAGIHNIPLRTVSYMNLDQAELMGAEGFVNYLVVNPAGGVTQDNARHALFMQPGVASVQAVADLPTAFEDVISMVTGLLVIIQVVVLVMAALITFNSTSISVDERRREIATLFAFGLRVRTVARMQVLENAAIGCLGTLIGLVLGFGLLHLIFATKIAEMFPEIQFAVEIAPGTLVVAGVLGILVSALSPLLSMRKMYRMDIPSTLRVME
jgi:putative ABC transport system permease protein